MKIKFAINICMHSFKIYNPINFWMTHLKKPPHLSRFQPPSCSSCSFWVFAFTFWLAWPRVTLSVVFLIVIFLCFTFSPGNSLLTFLLIFLVFFFFILTCFCFCLFFFVYWTDCDCGWDFNVYVFSFYVKTFLTYSCGILHYLFDRNCLRLDWIY